MLKSRVGKLKILVLLFLVGIGWARGVSAVKDSGAVPAGADGPSPISPPTEKLRPGVSSILVANPPPLDWNRTYGGSNDETAYSLIVTSDGYALAGTTKSLGAGNNDFWLVKTDYFGNSQWNRTYGGTGRDIAFSLIRTSDGGYALGGVTDSFGAGGYDFWLVKTDSVGNTLWNKTYGGASNDEARSLIQTSGGGYAMAGYTASYGNGGLDFWLIKTDPAGNVTWSKTYGGVGNEFALSVVTTPDEGYALAGYTNSYGAGGYDAWLVKTDSNGNSLWTKTYGGVYDNRATSLTRTSDGGYALSGIYRNFWTDDFWLIKTDSVGNPQWNRTFGDKTSINEQAASVVQTLEGGFALVGITYSMSTYSDDFWLVKTDSMGNMLWNGTYGGALHDRAYSLTQSSDGGYLVAGTTASFGAGGFDFWLVKTRGYDVTIKARQISIGQDISVDITMDGSPTGYTTPHIFTGLTGTHTFGVPSTLLFKRWSTGETNSTLAVAFPGGIYTAYYEYAVGTGNLRALSIEPVQSVWGVGLVQGKATDFRIAYQSTFSSAVETDILLEAPGFTPSSYQFWQRFFPGNHSFVIGSEILTSPFFLASVKPEAPFRFTIDPNNYYSETNETDNRLPNSGYMTSNVSDTRIIRILYVRVAHEEEPENRRITEVQAIQYAQEAQRFLLATYPLAEFEVTYDLGVEFVFTPNYIYSYLGFSPMEQLLWYLSWLTTWGSGYDRVVGLVSPNHPGTVSWIAGYLDSRLGNTVGWAPFDGVSVIVEANSVNYTSVVAHELGHTYGLGEDYPGAPDSAYFGGNSIVNSRGSGYYVLGRQTRNNLLTFMNFAGNLSDAGSRGRWVDSVDYNWLLSRLANPSDPEALLLSGIVFKNNTAALTDNWYRVSNSTQDFRDGSVGDYYVTLLDGSGNILNHIGFNATFLTGDPPIETDAAYFEFRIRWSEGTRLIQLRDASGNILASRAVSLNSPVVNIVSPNGGEVFTPGTNQTITWTASDPDGNNLTYNVAISKDGGSTWIPIALGLNETSFTYDFSDLSGGNQYLLSVQANDGINVGVDSSDAYFNIASFTMNVITPPQIVPNGGKANYILNITSYGGFNNPIALNASSLTSGLAFRWLNGSTINPIPNGSTQAILEVEVTEATQSGNQTVILSGTSGSNTEVAILHLFTTSHDIATVKIAPFKAVVGKGFPVRIDVTIQNQGNYPENSTISLYLNGTHVSEQRVYLHSGGLETVALIWNTTSFDKGNYTISANALPVPGETDTTDNTRVGGNIRIAMVGDIAGGPGTFPNTTPDGKVDIKDLAAIAKCYGANYPNPLYAANYDLNGDAKIDIKDLATAAKNYGKVDP